MVCPHCGYKQPSSNDYLAQTESVEETDGENSSEESHPPDVSPPETEVEIPAENQPTEEEQPANAPSAPAENSTEPSTSDVNRPPGLEPISFDELDELETLLSSDDHDIPEAPAEPDTATDEPGDAEPADAAADDATPPVEDGAEDASAGNGSTIWRFKSDYGLTYSFFAVEGLIRWAEALGEQSQALVTNDGVVWKPFVDFKKQVDSAGDAGAAFQNTEMNLQAPAEAASPVDTGQINREGPAARPKRPSGARRKGPAPRRKSSSAGSRNTRGGSRVGQSKPSSRRGAAKGGDKAAASSTAKIGYLVFGLLLGGSAVYFGMYVLGFYDLVFKF